MDHNVVQNLRQLLLAKAISGYPVAAIQDASAQIIKPLCNLCAQLLRQPIQLTCGHRYCEACLLTYIKSQKTSQNDIDESSEPHETTLIVCCAPDCNLACEWGEATNMTRAIERQLAKVAFVCANTDCGFSGTFIQYKKHYDECAKLRMLCEHCDLPCTRETIEQHLETCDKNPSLFTTCPYCNERLHSSLIDRHVEIDCVYKPRICEFCDTKYHESHDSHSAQCKLTSGRCKFGCEVDPETLAYQHYLSMEAYHHHILQSTVDSDEPAALKLSRYPEQYLDGIFQKIRLQHLPTKDFQSLMPLDLNKLLIAVGGSQKMSIEAVRTRLNEVNSTLQELQVQVQRSVDIMEELKSNTSGNDAQAKELGKKLEDFSLLIGKDEIALNSLSRRQKHLENMSIDGTSVWRISNFRKVLETAKQQPNYSIVSASFRTAPNGYSLRMRLFPNGFGASSGKMSLFVELCKSDTDAINKWPFVRTLELALLDQRQSEEAAKPFNKQHHAKKLTPNPKDPVQAAAFARPEKQQNPSFGVSDFFPVNDLLQPSSGAPIYLLNDTIFVQCVCEPFDSYFDESE